MEPITFSIIGQSNVVAVLKATSGLKQLPPANCKYLRNDELKFGTGWNSPKWGTYPLNRTADNGRTYSNNMGLAFTVRVAEALSIPVYSAQVANGGHPLEAFIKKEDRERNGWELRAAKHNMAPFIFDKARGLQAMLKEVPDYPHSFYSVIVLHQGEANEGDSRREFLAKTRVFVRELEEAGIKGPSTIMLVGGLLATGDAYPKHKSVWQQMTEEYANLYYVDSTGLGAVDHVHFSGDSLRKMGIHIANKYLEVRP
jgi:hypothetical protein